MVQSSWKSARVSPLPKATLASAAEFFGAAEAQANEAGLRRDPADEAFLSRAHQSRARQPRPRTFELQKIGRSLLRRSNERARRWLAATAMIERSSSTGLPSTTRESCRQEAVAPSLQVTGSRLVSLEREARLVSRVTGRGFSLPSRVGSGLTNAPPYCRCRQSGHSSPRAPSCDDAGAIHDHWLLSTTILPSDTNTASHPIPDGKAVRTTTVEHQRPARDRSE